MPGAIAPNLHEGSRSEYLAQYVFSSWGTVVAIPHQEDSGLDLFCTLVERQGQRAWAKSPYTVQVKSTMDAWEFKGEDEIKWLIEHPLPLFLCVVDKSSARLRVYQTSPRFHVWAGGSLPQRLSLVPTTETDGDCLGWKTGGTFSLRAPILDFTMEDTFSEDFAEWARRVLQTWVDVECANLDRQRIGIRNFIVPHQYHPNKPPDMRSTDKYVSHRIVAEDELQQALAPLKELLDFVGGELYKRKNSRGAALALLLHRHLYPGHLHPYMKEIISDLALEEDKFRHVGVERMEQVINAALAAKGCAAPNSAR